MRWLSEARHKADTEERGLKPIGDIANDMRARVALDKPRVLALDEREELFQPLIRGHVDADPSGPLTIEKGQLLLERGGFSLSNFDLNIHYPHLVVDGDDLVDARSQNRTASFWASHRHDQSFA